MFVLASGIFLLITLSSATPSSNEGNELIELIDPDVFIESNEETFIQGDGQSESRMPHIAANDVMKYTSLGDNHISIEDEDAPGDSLDDSSNVLVVFYDTNGDILQYDEVMNITDTDFQEGNDDILQYDEVMNVTDIETQEDESEELLGSMTIDYDEGLDNGQELVPTFDSSDLVYNDTDGRMVFYRPNSLLLKSLDLDQQPQILRNPLIKANLDPSQFSKSITRNGGFAFDLTPLSLYGNSRLLTLRDHPVDHQLSTFNQVLGGNIIPIPSPQFQVPPAIATLIPQAVTVTETLHSNTGHATQIVTFTVQQSSQHHQQQHHHTPSIHNPYHTTTPTYQSTTTSTVVVTAYQPPPVIQVTPSLVYVTKTKVETITQIKSTPYYVTYTETKDVLHYVTRTITDTVSRYVTYTVQITPEVTNTYTQPAVYATSTHAPAYATLTRTLTSNYHPPAQLTTNYRPPAPLTTSYRPPAPLTTSYRPPAITSTYRPPAPLSTTYRPPASNHNSPNRPHHQLGQILRNNPSIDRITDLYLRAHLKQLQNNHIRRLGTPHTLGNSLPIRSIIVSPQGNQAGRNVQGNNILPRL